MAIISHSVLLSTLFENLHLLIQWTMIKFQAVTTVVINSCLEDRRISLMRYKESIYTSHLKYIIIVKKQRSEWVAGTLLMGKVPPPSIFLHHAGSQLVWATPSVMILVTVTLHNYLLHTEVWLLTSCWLLQFANMTLRLCSQARSQYGDFFS